MSSDNDPLRTADPRGTPSPDPGVTSGPPGSSSPTLDSTVRLLERIRQGDPAAREILIRRYLGPLRRWAHGRLPASARHLLDTDDLVQITLVRTLSHLDGFVPTRQGAFFSYLRRALMNRILDEIRSARRMPERRELPDDVEDRGRSPLDRLLDRETQERYERALARLSEEQQEAIVMRIELGFPYHDIAVAQGRPSDNAARQFVVRALARLAEEIHATE